MTTEKRTTSKHIFIYALAALLTLLAVRCIYVLTVMHNAYDVKPLTDEKIKAADVNNASKLMIVAHPDDELLWGGGHLMEGGYMVLCITDGKDRVRSEEFYRVMKESGNEGIILEYPDKVRGKRDDWSRVRGGIVSDIERVMKYKDWELIVTHNKNGEYGHIHHQMLHSFVTQVYNDDEIDSRLYCFGKYFKRSKLKDAESTLTPITAQQLTYKEELEKLYKSQSETIKKLSHMNEYEIWEEYQPPVLTVES
ncbi:PIG-L family deacetylase [Ruminococcus sp. Marseille-P6503]|uniref:PIG-L family deacetylase n=1 Tax=Ruminococcus sp. Marseille-P6503 TaxID=2364796 RepID=UPI000F52F451|nr:PIG-L family deacetylase [Ruminococcus sp. Marseille-P6503]